MTINAEELAYWYLRLNGFLTIRALVVHPDWGRNQGTDIDILGVRFPHRSENLLTPMKDETRFSNIKDKPFVAITEVKRGLISLNKSWLDAEKPNLHRVMRFLGVLPTDGTEAAAEALSTSGVFSNDAYHISLVCIGETQNDDVASAYQAVPQITWDEVLTFVFNRFAEYRPQKTAHGQWDEMAQELWRLREHYRRDLPGFVSHVKENLEG